MAITASEARKNLFPLIDRVNDDQEPVEIVSRRGSAYLVSESQFRSLMETAYLLRSPANASRLLGSIAALEKGAGRIRDLVDADVEPAELAEPSEAVRSAKPATSVERASSDKAARGGSLLESNRTVLGAGEAAAKTPVKTTKTPVKTTKTLVKTTKAAVTTKAARKSTAKPTKPSRG